MVQLSSSVVVALFCQVRVSGGQFRGSTGLPMLSAAATEPSTLQIHRLRCFCLIQKSHKPACRAYLLGFSAGDGNDPPDALGNSFFTHNHKSSRVT